MLDPEAKKDLVRAYLQALEARDLESCCSFFAPEAVINFMEGIYEGSDAVRQWHLDRFDADMRLEEVEDVQIDGDTVTVQAVIRSNRLLDWKIKQLSGYAQATLQDDKIRDLSFGLNVTNPLEDWS